MGFNDELEIKTADDIVKEQLDTEVPKTEESVDTVAAAESEVKAEEAQTPAAEQDEEKKPAEEAVVEPSADVISDTSENETDPDQTPAISQDTENKPKRKFPLQVPVIIAACILLGALVGYFVFSAFFVHEPEGVWMLTTTVPLETGEEQEVTYYYEFANDESCVMTIGSIDNIGSYYKSVTEAGNSLYINQYYGVLAGEYQYTITGSNLFKTQKMTLTMEDTTYELTQVGKKELHLKVADDFTPVPELIGSWEYPIPEYNISYIFTFNNDGTMIYNQADTVIYNATYTVDDENIHMSFCALDPDNPEVIDLPYTVDGDSLNLMGLDCTRVGAASTANEA